MLELKRVRLTFYPKFLKFDLEQEKRGNSVRRISSSTMHLADIFVVGGKGREGSIARIR